MRRDAHAAKPLYRKVNSKAHGVCHGSGQAARFERNSKAGPRTSMHSGQRHGLDYTPLYRFLLKNVGQPWDSIVSRATPRIKETEALYHIVARSDVDRRKTARIGESSFFSGLYIDADGLLQIVAPDLTSDDLHPFCPCCTHSFNGEQIPNPYSDATAGKGWS